MQVSFNGHHSILKTLYKRGQLPQVKKGFYGETLNLNNASLEHLKPISKGGKTELPNLVLASNVTNNKRGDKPLGDFINFKAMAIYLEQFKNIKKRNFDGNQYIANILKTVGELLKGSKHEN